MGRKDVARLPATHCALFLLTTDFWFLAPTQWHAYRVSPILAANMALSPTDVRHIAKLARLTLSDAQVTKFAKELTSILDYVDVLKEVDTSAVEPTAQVTGACNVLREDAVEPSSAERAALLSTSPLPIVDNQIETPSAHG